MSNLPVLLPEELQVYAGDDNVFSVSLFDDDAQLEPTDLTGLVLTSAWLSNGNYVPFEIREVDFSLGQFEILVSASATYLMVGDSRMVVRGDWDVQSVDVDGWTHTPLRGVMSVTPDVTRA